MIAKKITYITVRGVPSVKVVFQNNHYYSVINEEIEFVGKDAYITRVFANNSEYYEISEGDIIEGEIIEITTLGIVELCQVTKLVLFGEELEEDFILEYALEFKEEEEQELPPNCIITKINEEMGQFDFLSDITLKAVETKAAAVKVEKLPTGMCLRIMKNGAMYPSKELAEKYSLEYQAKGSEIASYGMDIFKSTDFSMLPAGTPSFLLAGFVKAPAAKVDIFSSTKYDEIKGELLTPAVEASEGVEAVAATYAPSTFEPKASVLTQGSASFGEAMFAMLNEAYGFQMAEGQKFVDLVLAEGNQIVSPNGKYVVPKLVSRGEKKGSMSYEMRDGMLLFPISIVATETTTDAVVEEEIQNVEAADAIPTEVAAEVEGTVENAFPVEPAVVEDFTQAPAPEATTANPFV